MRRGIVTRPLADSPSEGEPTALPARRSRRFGAPNAERKDFKMEQKLKIAVFIDFDNIEIGVKSTLRREFDVSLALDALKERGDLVAKFAEQLLHSFFVFETGVIGPKRNFHRRSVSRRRRLLSRRTCRS